jgi:hypothetical protein
MRTFQILRTSVGENFIPPSGIKWRDATQILKVEPPSRFSYTCVNTKYMISLWFCAMLIGPWPALAGFTQ